MVGYQESYNRQMVRGSIQRRAPSADSKRSAIRERSVRIVDHSRTNGGTMVMLPFCVDPLFSWSVMNRPNFAAERSRKRGKS